VLPPETAEIGLLSSIKEPRDLTTTLRVGVTQELFLLYGDVFQYLVDFHPEYEGQLPRREDVEAMFASTDQALKFTEGGELKFYVDELLALYTARQVSEAVRGRFGEGATRLSENPHEVVRLLLSDLQQLNTRRSRNVSFLDKDALQRLSWVEERVKASQAGEILGIPTGLKIFDDHQQGWQPGECGYIIGGKGVGKSWLVMYQACVAYRYGKRVMVLSPEMSWEECSLRVDVLLGCLMQREFSHEGLTSGKLVDLKAYQKWLTDLTSREDFICVDSADVGGGFTLASILDLMEEFQPDLTVLDGIHLIRGQAKDKGWEIIKAAADGMKAAAQRTKSVMIWTGQVDKDSNKNSGEPAISGGQAAYSKAAVEAANRVISLARDPGNPLRRTFKVPNNRSGREFLTKQRLAFEVDRGYIEQVDVEEPATFAGMPEV